MDINVCFATMDFQLVCVSIMYGQRCETVGCNCAYHSENTFLQDLVEILKASAFAPKLPDNLEINLRILVLIKQLNNARTGMQSERSAFNWQFW